MSTNIAPTAVPESTATPTHAPTATLSAYYYIELGIAYRHREYHDRAIASFNKAIELDPSNARAYYNQGVAYSDKEDYDRAIANFNKAIELNPNNADAYHLRGLTYVRQKDHNNAIADLNMAIKLNPNNADFNEGISFVYRSRALAYLRREDYDKAIADYDRLIELDPSNADAYMGRGLAYQGEKDYDRAIDSFNKVIELDPSDDLHKSAKESLLDLTLSAWDCDLIGDKAKDLSRRRVAGTTRSIILKMYNLKETFRFDNLVECSGEARLSVGPDRQNIIVYVEKDEDGDIFTGYRLE